MKRILVLLVVLFSIGFSKDLTELGSEAYDKGDYQKAAELLQKACDGGDAMGCYSLGFLYQNGQGVKQDYQKAAELYQKGCDGRNAGGCSNLGVLYQNGQGVKQDYQKAAELYQKACDGGGG
ncbi:tetratricopeptide repeat protein [Campylobacter concisus]|uniref:tetratricopeptide repeat protein n=1 Tax=Campylobacter concisus TaxID=199 RepID=UPI00122C4BA4|nr:tetratricopeptide repeat protein [Campylobacter concisus]